jgi:replicative DNA helicase
MPMPRDINELPNNPEAEQGLIGMAMVKGFIPPSARGLSTTDFYDRGRRDIWSAVMELAEEHRPVDPLLVGEIVKRNTGREVKASELLAMSAGMPSTNESLYVDKIREAAIRRLIIAQLHDSINAIVRGEKNAIGNLKGILADLEFIEDGKGAFVSMEDVVEKEIKPALYELENGITHKISTGWPAIDRVIGGGLSLSDMMLVAALPGSGKSAFVLQLASNIAKQGYKVAFLSGEMSNRENGLRLLSQLSGTMNLNSATHISAQEREFLCKWAEEMKKLPIEWNCRTYDMRTLSASLRPLVDRGVQVLVVDYIQLLKLDKMDRKQRTERISECSQELKRIAMEHELAVIEVAQFNREGAKSGSPTMQDLEGSSQLEKDTSLICLIDQVEGSNAVNIRIVKGRNTGTTAIEGIFEGWKLTFSF